MHCTTQQLGVAWAQRRIAATDEAIGLEQCLECVILTIKLGQKLVVCGFGIQEVEYISKAKQTSESGNHASVARNLQASKIGTFSSSARLQCNIIDRNPVFIAHSRLQRIASISLGLTVLDTR